LANADRSHFFGVETSTLALYPDMQLRGKDAFPTMLPVYMMLKSGEPDAKPVSEMRTKGWTVDLTGVDRTAAERDSKVWVSNDFMLVYGQDLAKFLPIVSDPVKRAQYLDSIDVVCPLYDLLCGTDDLKQERENRKIPANMKTKAWLVETS
jgi:hypothetical protein